MAAEARNLLKHPAIRFTFLREIFPLLEKGSAYSKRIHYIKAFLKLAVSI
jgi:hypothetical protein